MKYANGQIVTVSQSAMTNQVGGTSLIKEKVQAKIIDSFYDYETGERYIGELFREEDIQVAKATGKSEYTPEDYRKYGEKMYLETLESFNNYNPKKVYFSEFDIAN